MCFSSGKSQPMVSSSSQAQAPIPKPDSNANATADTIQQQAEQRTATLKPLGNSVGYITTGAKPDPTSMDAVLQSTWPGVRGAI